MKTKNHLLVTVSNLSGSHHYTFKGLTKRGLILIFLLGVLTTFVLGGFDVFQYMNSSTLRATNSSLTEKLAFHNSNRIVILKEIASYVNLIDRLEKELEEIERIGGVDPREVASEAPIDLGLRIRAINQLYSSKEEKYAMVRIRLDHIENLMELGGRPMYNGATNLDNRVSAVEQNTSHAQFLHSNIPNGYPTKRQKITSEYGNRIHPIKKVMSFHQGIDLRAEVGADVWTTADGIVRTAEYTKLSGNLVVIEHNYGFETYYAHLDKLKVNPGDIVRKGAVVGTAGNSGRSYGPHLHYEVRHLQSSIDPYPFLKWEFGSHDIFKQEQEIPWLSLINLIKNQTIQRTLPLSQREQLSQGRL